jgi:hypothetical protein
MEGPTKSAPIFAPWSITLLAGRFMPTARLHVATITLITPWSYAVATRSRSSVVNPASRNSIRKVSDKPEETYDERRLQ